MSGVGPSQIVVVFYSRFGVVRRLAECVAEGAGRVPGTEVRFLEVEDQSVEELRAGETHADMLRRRAAVVNVLTSAHALVVGAPGYFGSMASPVKRLFEDCATASIPPATDRTRPWRHHLFHNKIGAAFTATGTPHGGNEETLRSILTMFIHLGMVVVTPGQQPPILENPAPPYGASAVSGAEANWMPTPDEEQHARDLGERVAEHVTWLRLGYAQWAQNRELGAIARPLGADRPI